MYVQTIRLLLNGTVLHKLQTHLCHGINHQHLRKMWTQTGPKVAFKFFAKHSPLCFSVQKLTRYKTHLKSFVKYHAATIP